MDANGTRYHLLLGKANWAACLDADGTPLSESWKEGVDNNTGLVWDPENHQLLLEPLLYTYVASPADTPPAVEDRRGAARDNQGIWYWIDPSKKRIRTTTSGSRTVSDYYPVPETFICPPEAAGAFQPVEATPTPASLDFSGLCITEGQYLVVGVLAPAGLLIFDLLGGGAPIQVLWPDDVPFVPFDMAPAPGGGLWVLDRQHKRYWALDRFFNIITQGQEVQPGLPPQADTFQPTSGEPHLHTVRNFPLGIRLDDAANLDQLEDPTAIETLPDCTVLVLDRRPSEDFSAVARYRYNQQLGAAVSLEVIKQQIEEATQAPFTLTAHDMAFTPPQTTEQETAGARLYIASSSGNQTFAFHIAWDDTTLTLQPLPEIYLPMRLFSGKGLVSTGDAVYYDLEERWLPLVRQFRPRYRTYAELYHTFDSRLPGCTWHRLMLDACLPPDTAVTVSSRAADDLQSLTLQPWHTEILYLRGSGSELPFAGNAFQKPVVPGGTPPPLPAGAGTWELLFQRARGQLLQIHVELSGSGQRTPRLRAMRIYYPRFSYLNHYLPAAYRQDAASADFLDRYLANLEGFYTATEDRIIQARQLFDVSSAPVDALDWLAGWFGALLDPAWDEQRRRLFIRYAMLFFQYRGTLRGLRMALRLALDECVSPDLFLETCCREAAAQGKPTSALRIVESFRSRRFPGVLLGDPGDTQPKGILQGESCWKPEQGRAVLDDLYKTATGNEEGYPIRRPTADTARWEQFSLSTLGFVPAASPSDWNLWQAFLMRTYGTVMNYNTAYGLSAAAGLESFDEAALPADLPADGAPLADWYQFETVFLPLAHKAHHFVVLLPMKSGMTRDSQVYQDRITLAKKVVELEKPAHTTYDIRLFWALFRIGEARLGLDTQLDVGSRNPNFPAPFIIGQESLAEGYLATDRPALPGDRLALGAGCIPGKGSTIPPRVQRPQIRYAKTTSRCTG